MQNKFKFLTLSLLVATSLGLAACDKSPSEVSNPNSSSDTTIINAQKGVIDNTASSSIVNLGYDTVPEQLIRQLDEARNAPAKQILTLAYKNYLSFLGQIANLPYSSEEYKNIKSYVKTFVDKTNESALGFGIHANFANDVNDEATLMTDSQTPGYPSLPGAESSDADYKKFRDKFLEVYKKNVHERLDIYKTKDYQERYYDGGYNENNILRATEVVDGYLKIVDDLTKNDFVCSKQSNSNAKAKCFIEQMEIISQVPNLLTRSAALKGINQSPESLEQEVTIVFREKAIGTLISFFNVYVKPLELPEFSTK